MIIKHNLDTGETWKDPTNNVAPGQVYYCSCITSTGRLIVGSSSTNIYGQIWASDDNGDTWYAISLPVDYDGGSIIALYVTSSGRILAGCETHCIWYSDNNGATWTKLVDNIGVACFCTTATGRIIAGAIYGYFYYSDDNGNSWTSTSFSEKVSGTNRLCVTNTGRIICSTGVPGDFNSFNGAYYSDDNGITWLQLRNDISHGLCVTSTGRIIAGGPDGIMYSDDNGATWVDTNNGYYYFESYCATSTGRIVASGMDDYSWESGTGVCYSDDNGITWEQSALDDSPWVCLCIPTIDRIIACCYGYPPGNIKYSDPETAPEVVTKYLNKAAVQELVAQFKAYVQSKK